MRIAIAVGTAALLLALPLSSTALTTGVSIEDDHFSPSSKTVVKGTTVKWTWRGRDEHNVTVARGPVTFESPTKSKGSFSRKLRKVGTYRIICTIHAGMKMTLKVKRP